MAGIEDFTQGCPPHFDNNNGNAGEHLYDKGIVSHNAFVLSEDFGDKGDVTYYNVRQSGANSTLMENAESYADDSAQAPNVPDGEDSSIREQIPGSILYDFSPEYCSSQPNELEGYDMRCADNYNAAISANDTPVAMPRSISGGMTGGMVMTPTAGMSNAEDNMDTINGNYWYGCQIPQTPYSPGPCSPTAHPRNMPQYGGYRYGPSSPYYHLGGTLYGTYSVDRNMPYSVGYNMSSESVYHGKQHYLPYAPRRSVSSSFIQGTVKPSHMPCYHLPSDQMGYKNWYSNMPNLENGGMQPASMLHPQQHDPRASHRAQRFNSEILYSELTSRLQREMTNKRHVSSGRPKMNRHNYVCAMCNAKSTPQWRYIKGTSVCNACYMRIRKQKQKQQQQQDEEIARSDCASAETEVPDDGRTDEATSPDKSSGSVS
ncbi:uncharacterized protein BXIN_1288 [Babesia sp. Xinjiang]|uniref:uncharacterized protein n=1 Tax=Babesia sp. Xinjiang TaxID=462227 RepID=UPI000A259532|nr:uncharacterized protein BXIN_1288 [Babesia sp. Xinjiang]ORM39929.1 hypothetical protein BXIN_1288 [Babesia sp. Xinjiang]